MGPAPSSDAASFCSSSSDCSAVNRMRLANGSHSQETTMITDSIGQLVNQTIGWNPNDRAIQANKPESGFIKRFFHTSALTVGITKNGAITMSRSTFWPNTG